MTVHCHCMSGGIINTLNHSSIEFIQFSMLIVQKTNVSNVIFWTDNCYLCHIMKAPWRTIKDLDQLQNKDKNGWPVKLKRNKFCLLQNNPQWASFIPQTWTSSMYLYINVICKTNAVTGGLGVWRWGFFYFTAIVDNVIHVLLIELRIFVELSVQLWHGFWFSLPVIRMNASKCLHIITWQPFIYRVRSHGGNLNSESVSRLQSDQHRHFQYTVIFGYILPFEDNVFGSCKSYHELDGHHDIIANF